MPSESTTIATGGTTWTVPNYVNLLRLVAHGGHGTDASASGDNTGASNGANGGEVKGDYSTSPDSTLRVLMDGGGSGGSASSGGTSATGGDGGNGVEIENYDSFTKILNAGGGGGGGGAAGSNSNEWVASGHGSGAGGGSGESVGEVSVNNFQLSTVSGGGSGGNGGGNGDSGTASSPPGAAAGGGGGGGNNGGEGGNAKATSAGEPGEDEAHAQGGAGGDGAAPNATNTSITVGGSNYNNATAVIKYSERVTDLSTDSSVEDELTLNWSSITDVDSYNIYRAESSGSSTGDYTQVDSGISSNSTSYTDTGLEDGERYYYRIENANSFDNRLSNESTAVTVLPNPTNFSATYNKNTFKADLSWTNNDDSTDGWINVEKSDDGGNSWTEIDTINYDSTSYTDGDVEAGDSPTYRVIRTTGPVTATSTTNQIDVAGSIFSTRDGVRINLSAINQTK